MLDYHLECHRKIVSSSAEELKRKLNEHLTGLVDKHLKNYEQKQQN